MRSQVHWPSRGLLIHNPHSAELWSATPATGRTSPTSSGVKRESVTQPGDSALERRSGSSPRGAGPLGTGWTFDPGMAMTTVPTTAAQAACFTRGADAVFGRDPERDGPFVNDSIESGPRGGKPPRIWSPAPSACSRRPHANARYDQAASVAPPVVPCLAGSEFGNRHNVLGRDLPSG